MFSRGSLSSVGDAGTSVLSGDNLVATLFFLALLLAAVVVTGIEQRRSPVSAEGTGLDDELGLGTHPAA